MYAIEIENIGKNFQGNTIFKGLSYLVKESDIVTIIGESGKGKTTLLRCLAGLEKIDAGNIKIFGQELVKDGKYTNTKRQNEILKNIGIIFQNYSLFPNLSVRQNLEIVLNDPQKIDSLLKYFNMYEKQNLYPQNLSGGQKQRVAIIRALLLDPKIILFDEPTSALDDKNRQQIIKLIYKLQKSNRTIIVVTHDDKLIENLDSKILDMNKI